MIPVTPDLSALPQQRRLSIVHGSFAAFLDHYARPGFDADVNTGWPIWFQAVYPQLGEPGPWELDVATFRGSAKSTLLAEWFVLWCAICTEWAQSAMVLGGNATLGQERLKLIRRQVEGNQRIIDDFGMLAHPDEWAVSQSTILKPFHTGSVASRPQCVIRAAGAGTHLRGSRGGSSHRPDVVVKDDLQRDVGDALSVEDFREWEEATIGRIGSPRRIEINIGNLTPQLGLTIAERLAGVGYTNADGSKTEPLDPSATGRYSHRKRFKFKALDDNGCSMWPDNPSFTVDALERIRATVTPSTWAAEYQNDPLHPGTATFPPSLFERGNWYGPAPMDGDAARARWEGAGIFGAVDPAISKSETADYTAIATVARDRDGRLYVLDVAKGRWSMSETLDQLAAAWRRWRWHWLGVEAVAYQRALHEAVDAMSRKVQGMDIRTRPIKTDTDKVRRIETLEPLLRNGTLRLADDQDHIRSEFLSYRPRRTHDDVLDALEMAATLARSISVKPMLGMKKRNGNHKRRGDWYRQQEVGAWR